MNSKYSYKIFQILLNSPKLDYKIKVYSGRDKNYLNSGESNKSQSLLSVVQIWFGIWDLQNSICRMLLVQ